MPRLLRLLPPAVALLAVACARPPIRGFAHPESVLHDEVADVYLVSNVVGEAMERDRRGFLSRIDPVTGAVDHEFVVGGRNGAELHGPKGMAIVGDVLFVADLDTIRRFDRRDGRPLGNVPVPGAHTLNGMCRDDDGNVYVGDPAWSHAGAPAGEAGLWRLSPDGRLTRLGSGPGLAEPNGLVFHDGSLHWASWSDGKLRRLSATGACEEVLTLPHQELDGILPLGDGRWVYSSWKARAVVLHDPGAGDRVLAKQGGCAGFGVDRKRGRLLLPSWHEDCVRILDFAPAGP